MLTYPHFDPAFPRERWTIKDVLAHQAEIHGERPFLEWGDGGEKLSFAEADRAANRLARGFLRQGILKGDRVVLFMPNSLDYVLSWFGLNKMGAVQVPINTELKNRLLEHQINSSRAKAIIVDDTLLTSVLNSVERLSDVSRIFVRTGPLDGDSLPTVTSFGASGQIIPFAELLDADDSETSIDVSPQDLAAIMFTSGTTGPSKGVMMPNAHLFLFAQIGLKAVQLGRDDTYMSMLPLFHANAQLLAVLPSLIAGARCVLFDRFSSSRWLDRARSSNATVTNTIGVMMPFICEQVSTSQDRNHSLRAMFVGGTPYDVIDRFSERFAVHDFCDAFGQTEICLPILTPLAKTSARPTGAAGLLLDQWFDARIVDPLTDEELPAGEVGELVIRPKYPWTINLGYAGMADKSVEAWRNLWFHTGDALRRDPAGWFYFIDRISDTIRRRGENISSFDVESALLEHIAIAEVAAVAVPANDGGGEDEVKACIVLRAGSSTAHEELLDWCRDRLPSFAVPRFFEFRSSLPKTPSEKVKKSELRAEGVTASTWDRNAKHVAASGQPIVLNLLHRENSGGE